VRERRSVIAGARPATTSFTLESPTNGAKMPAAFEPPPTHATTASGSRP
jgi:hypothetical protein